ncbi:MAG: lipid-A-disaccharide synthase N-terminal domain-containing protein [Planctomycetota bacterium]|jgi:lipid-A-disaccharide synthase-like uncharacterized protein
MFDSIIEFFKSAITEQIVKDLIWATTAFVGQVVFGGRFILQWIVSEYKKKSHVPTAFWFMSLAGSLILFSYSVHRKKSSSDAWFFTEHPHIFAESSFDL